MCSIIFLSVIFSLIIPIIHALANESRPIIAVTQGVIENENLLPISVFWYHPNFTGEDHLSVNFSNSEGKFISNFKIESYIGFYEVPRTALARGKSPDDYCAVILSEQGISGSSPTCEPKFQWMYDRRDVLGSHSLRELIIPGTHHSAAYDESNNGSSNIRNLISDWILCQTKSIKTQLMDGIRYLDLRPTFKYEDGKIEYMISYGEFNLFLMDDVVREIMDFMDTSKDVVIVCFQGFSDEFFLNEDHSNFINYLEFSFGRHAHPRRDWAYTLNQFWADDKRLILSYDHDTYVASRYMWTPITHYWADAQTIGQLHSYLNVIHRNHANDIIPYAAIVTFLHPTIKVTQNISVNRGRSIRLWAERLSKYVLQWYTEEWNSLAHIIVVDFYQTSGIVDIAIQLNEKRFKDPHLYEKL